MKNFKKLTIVFVILACLFGSIGTGLTIDAVAIGGNTLGGMIFSAIAGVSFFLFIEMITMLIIIGTSKNQEVKHELKGNLLVLPSKKDKRFTKRITAKKINRLKRKFQNDIHEVEFPCILESINRKCFTCETIQDKRLGEIQRSFIFTKDPKKYPLSKNMKPLIGEIVHDQDKELFILNPKENGYWFRAAPSKELKLKILKSKPQGKVFVPHDFVEGEMKPETNLVYVEKPTEVVEYIEWKPKVAEKVSLPEYIKPAKLIILEGKPNGKVFVPSEFIEYTNLIVLKQKPLGFVFEPSNVVEWIIPTIVEEVVEEVSVENDVVETKIIEDDLIIEPRCVVPVEEEQIKELIILEGKEVGTIFTPCEEQSKELIILENKEIGTIFTPCEEQNKTLTLLILNGKEPGKVFEPTYLFENEKTLLILNNKEDGKVFKPHPFIEWVVDFEPELYEYNFVDEPQEEIIEDLVSLDNSIFESFNDEYIDDIVWIENPIYEDVECSNDEYIEDVVEPLGIIVEEYIYDELLGPVNCFVEDNQYIEDVVTSLGYVFEEDLFDENKDKFIEDIVEPLGIIVEEYIYDELLEPINHIEEDNKYIEDVVTSLGYVFEENEFDECDNAFIDDVVVIDEPIFEEVECFNDEYVEDVFVEDIVEINEPIFEEAEHLSDECVEDVVEINNLIHEDVEPIISSSENSISEATIDLPIEKSQEILEEKELLILPRKYNAKSFVPALFVEWLCDDQNDDNTSIDETINSRSLINEEILENNNVDETIIEEKQEQVLPVVNEQEELITSRCVDSEPIIEPEPTINEEKELLILPRKYNAKSFVPALFVEWLQDDEEDLENNEESLLADVEPNQEIIETIELTNTSDDVIKENIIDENEVVSICNESNDELVEEINNEVIEEKDLNLINLQQKEIGYTFIPHNFVEWVNDEIDENEEIEVENEKQNCEVIEDFVELSETVPNDTQLDVFENEIDDIVSLLDPVEEEYVEEYIEDIVEPLGLIVEENSTDELLEPINQIEEENEYIEDVVEPLGLIVEEYIYNELLGPVNRTVEDNNYIEDVVTSLGYVFEENEFDETNDEKNDQFIEDIVEYLNLIEEEKIDRNIDDIVKTLSSIIEENPICLENVDEIQEITELNPEIIEEKELLILDKKEEGKVSFFEDVLIEDNCDTQEYDETIVPMVDDEFIVCEPEIVNSIKNLIVLDKKEDGSVFVPADFMQWKHLVQLSKKEDGRVFNPHNFIEWEIENIETIDNNENDSLIEENDVSVCEEPEIIEETPSRLIVLDKKEDGSVFVPAEFVNWKNLILLIQKEQGSVFVPNEFVNWPDLEKNELYVEVEDLFTDDEIVGDDSRIFEDNAEPEKIEEVGMTLKKTIVSSLFTGKYNVVFIKRPPARLFQKIYIIDRSSQSIIGEAMVKMYERGLKKLIWNKYHKNSTITKKEYDTYYSSSLLACALVVRSISKYRIPEPITKYGIEKVPSTFVYINDEKNDKE